MKGRILTPPPRVGNAWRPDRGVHAASALAIHKISAPANSSWRSELKRRERRGPVVASRCAPCAWASMLELQSTLNFELWTLNFIPRRMSPTLKVAVLGTGSLGKEHARI